jgi:hypothetical protein
MLPSEKINERVVDQLSQSITGKTWIVVDEIDQKGVKGGGGLEKLKPDAPPRRPKNNLGTSLVQRSQRTEA